MSIVSVTERPSRNASKAVNSPFELERVFLVVSDDVNDGEYDILSADPVFTLGSIHPRTFAARLNSVNAVADETQLVWTVTLRYATSHVGPGPAEEQRDNPLDDEPEYEWFFIEESKPLDKDVLGNPVCSSSREQFDPLPEVVHRYPALRITRNEATFDIALAIEYMSPFEAINGDDFMDGVGINEAKLAGMSARKANRNSTYYWVVTYELHFKAGGWEDLYLLDHGYCELINGKRVTIRDKNGVALNEPHWLNGAGRLEETDTPHWRYYEIHNVKNFADLRLF
jgi:hypothetical protein